MILTALHWLIGCGLLVLALAMLACVWRAVRGPTLADRALAVDTTSVLLIGLSLLLGMRTQTAMYLDGALVLSLLSFAGTVALGQYLARRGRQKEGTP